MIQWFPGHMAKAQKEMKQQLSLVDVVIELVDARAPAASQNPMLQEFIKNKQKIIVLMKKDLADKDATDTWLTHFQHQNIEAVAVDVDNRQDISRLIDIVYKTGRKQQEKMIAKGVKERSVRALIAGVPNVGKSTLINRLANRKIAKIGDRPGVTKHQQWIKVQNQFELLDTPGILWPKFENELIGKKLAAIGTIKFELIPTQDIAAYILQYVYVEQPERLYERYHLEDVDDMWETFEQIGKSRGALESGGHVNFDKVADIILQDFRGSRLGKITLELPNDE